MASQMPQDGAESLISVAVGEPGRCAVAASVGLWAVRFELPQESSHAATRTMQAVITSRGIQGMLQGSSSACHPGAFASRKQTNRGCLGSVPRSRVSRGVHRRQSGKRASMQRRCNAWHGPTRKLNYMPSERPAELAPPNRTATVGCLSTPHACPRPARVRRALQARRRALHERARTDARGASRQRLQTLAGVAPLVRRRCRAACAPLTRRSP
mmetsp:Transcript_10634/g.31333  ORF Transcript_10634/g.31333 Transcript_10634/m.31333 type:complete len:213 (-) Transcript_10634:69-707(-)